MAFRLFHIDSFDFLSLYSPAFYVLSCLNASMSKEQAMEEQLFLEQSIDQKDREIETMLDHICESARKLQDTFEKLQILSKQTIKLQSEKEEAQQKHQEEKKQLEKTIDQLRATLQRTASNSQSSLSPPSSSFAHSTSPSRKSRRSARRTSQNMNAQDISSYFSQEQRYEDTIRSSYIKQIEALEREVESLKKELAEEIKKRNALQRHECSDSSLFLLFTFLIATFFGETIACFLLSYV